MALEILPSNWELWAENRNHFSVVIMTAFLRVSAVPDGLSAPLRCEVRVLTGREGHCQGLLGEPQGKHQHPSQSRPLKAVQSQVKFSGCFKAMLANVCWGRVALAEGRVALRVLGISVCGLSTPHF